MNSDNQRWFAVEVVKQLRAHGHESYWAGGCVRDELMGCVPKDYDVATSARPEQIREIFGKRRTLAIGAAFGVITVLGPKGAGQIEVATFREDLDYRDGRRPDEVRFSSAECDARRRDFTINGMFFDPLERRLIDFVGGQQDLKLRLIRAIGDASERFREDKLRMLRAVRFAATLDFTLEQQTADAIRAMAAEIIVVSAERIGAEMRMMLAGPGRSRAMELLRETGLLQQILPEALQPAEASGTSAGEGDAWRARLQLLDALDRPTFPRALAVALGWPGGAEHVASAAARWRLSNKEIERTAWLLNHSRSLDAVGKQPWSRVQPVLAHEAGGELLALYQAAAGLGRAAQEDIQFCRDKLALPRHALDPPPLVTGADLIAIGVPKGKLYAELLKAARAAQLDGIVRTADEARELVRRQWQPHRL